MTGGIEDPRALALLATAIVMLAVGPVLHRFARSRPGMLAGLDAFVVVAIGGLVLLDIVPEALREIGWPVAVAVLLGLLGPTMAERLMERSAHRAHIAALVVALVGVALHAVFDGVALHPAVLPGDILPHGALPPGAAGGWNPSALAVAVILHRLPVGLTVWLLLRPAYGRALAGGALALLAGSTVAGFFLGGWLTHLTSSAPIAIFKAFVGGSLLHVVIHRSHVGPDRARSGRRWGFEAGLGALAAIVLVAALPHDAVHDFAGHDLYGDHPSLGGTILALALESAPALLIGYAAAGLVATFLPRGTVAWMRRGGPASGALRGLAFGLPLPICSCGVIPLYRSLVSCGAPATAAMAFLVATPELGLDAVVLSVPLLGVSLSIARVLAAAVLAILVGVFVGRLAEARGAPRAAGGTEDRSPVGSVGARLLDAVRVGFGEVFQATAPWILLGLLIAALAQPLLEGGWAATVPAGLQVPLFALLGLPTYICASGATPLVAVLIAQGVSPGAAIAFLLTGPATNVTTFGVLRELHGRRIAVFFAATMAGLSILAGFATNLLVMPGGGFAPQAAYTAASAPPLQLIALGILGFVLLLALLRVGPRTLLEGVFPPHDDRPTEARRDACCGESAGEASGETKPDT